ncbi:MAG: glycoside hydrolase family 88 protein [Bacteroidetes bacterium]|nr:glycoside hydrolase family 88 protein [Bacteroidota bacterium]
MKNILISVFFFAADIFAQNPEPLTVAKNIADKIISETSFAFSEVEQKLAADLQVIDFGKAFGNKGKVYAYALANISVNENIKLKFGVSYSSPIKIFINEKLIFTGKEQPKFHFKETAYSSFSFQDTIPVVLSKGSNRIVIESLGDKNPVVYLREITAADQNPNSKFLPVSSQIKNYTWPWCFYSTGKNGAEKISVDSLFSMLASDKCSCTILQPALIKKLIINPNSTFKKDSYADWNYPNGALMMTLMKLSNATGDERYHEFVKKYCDFIYENLPLFKKQYFANHDIHGSYHRIFRKSMLDDTGAPTLPFAEVEIKYHNKDYDTLINEMVDYVFNGQTRLPDGTLCRPEPERWTVWADDLFMSVPLLVRAGVLYNDKKCFDEAAKQIINFNKYLFDSKTGLYKHGWFSMTNEKSKVFWGRANGWIVLAISEALKFLPKDHPSYKKIEQIFREHLEGIVNHQDSSSMWHQILDDKSSFEETSCTAMFIAGLSRGIMNGLIDKKYSGNVLKAWYALQSKIDSTGIVKDICCGTGIGMNADFYKSRERFNNDPRGLGAVITAAIEINELEKFLNESK